MDQHQPDETPPTPEQLAAFLDGELDATTLRAVEQWLAAHPEALAEIESQRTLDRLWHETAPSEPTEEAWSAVLNHIADTASRRPIRRSVRTASIAWLAAALTAAATLLLIVWSDPSTSTDKRLRAVLPVLGADDVQIISMDAADASVLVVGEPPHRGAIVMASADDVIVHASGADVAVLMPDQMDQDTPAWPLVLVKGSDQEP